MICLNCNKNKAQNISPYGFLPCTECQEHQRQLSKPKKSVEMTTDQVRNERKMYSKDILQPFREGVLSKEYLKEYGTATIKATPEDIKNAKNVWSGENEYYQPE